MPIYDVRVDTLDRRSSFNIDWEADSADLIIQTIKRDGAIDVLDEDGGLEFYPLAGIRKITVTEKAGE
jgi:hypothetical protein